MVTSSDRELDRVVVVDPERERAHPPGFNLLEGQAGEEAGEAAGAILSVLRKLLTFYPECREISWALAGHPFPLRLDLGVELNGAAEPSPPLGMTTELDCQQCRVTLARGEGMVVFTDGLTEARRAPRPRRGSRRQAAGFHRTGTAPPWPTPNKN